MSLAFEWDSTKATENHRKHGVTFLLPDERLALELLVGGAEACILANEEDRKLGQAM